MSKVKIKKIGITGGIGSGKTTIANIFKKLNFQVIDADKIAREAVLPGSKTLEQIKKVFGVEVINKGQLDRKKLGRIIFSNSIEKKKLNNIIQPSIARLICLKTSFLIKSKRIKTLIYDIPLLYEENLQRFFSSIIVVYAPENIRIHRIKKRDKILKKEAINRIHSQMSLEKKKNMADFVIDNSYFDINSLKIKVLEFIRKNRLIK